MYLKFEVKLHWRFYYLVFDVEFDLNTSTVCRQRFLSYNVELYYNFDMISFSVCIQ